MAGISLRKAAHFKRKSANERNWFIWQQFRWPGQSWKNKAVWFVFYMVGLTLLLFHISQSWSRNTLTAIVNTDQHISASFSKCIRGAGYNCVIDGDTFRFQGERIRIADINTPETYKPQCDHEARLGAQATTRLLELLNEGAFLLQAEAGQDEDRYGRMLRYVMRDGYSIGNILVSEGLAHHWAGYKQSWCG